MVWAKKASAPNSFDLATAFSAIIAGDIQYEWLTAWIPFMGTTFIPTDLFCSLGPPSVEQMTPETFSLTTATSPLSIAQLIVQRTFAIGQAARDVVFSAYCEQPGTPGVMTWGAEHCGVMNAAALAGGWGFLATDGEAPWDSLRIVSVTGSGGAGQVTVGTGTGAAALRAVGSFGGSGGTAVPYETGGAAPAGDTSVWVAQASGGATVATVCVQFGHLGGGISNVPTPQPEPAGLVAPGATIGATLGSIATELGVQEGKLDFLMQAIMRLEALLLPIGQPDLGAETAPAADDLVDLPADAVGVIIRVQNRPDTVSFISTNPANYPTMGWATQVTEDGDYPSTPITHDSELIQPLSPRVKGVSVTMHPPMTFTVTPILPAK